MKDCRQHFIYKTGSINFSLSISCTILYSGNVWQEENFGKFGEPSAIHQTKTIQVISNLLGNLLICQTFFAKILCIHFCQTLSPSNFPTTYGILYTHIIFVKHTTDYEFPLNVSILCYVTLCLCGVFGCTLPLPVSTETSSSLYDIQL